MDDDLPFSPGGNIPGLFGDLLRLLKTDSPVQWDLALQLAVSVAADNAAEENPDPLERIRLEQLVRIAELHVADITGMTTTPSGRPLEVQVATRGEWARRLLDEARPTFEAIGNALAPSRGGEPVGLDAPAAGSEGAMAALISQWASAAAPAMIGMQIGSVVGHLAKRTLGQYDLPLARRAGDSITVVARNISAFAEDWSLPADDLALYVMARDVTFHAVLSRPHVAARLTELLARHAEGFRPDPSQLQERLGQASVDMSDISELTRLLGDPSALGELVDSPEQQRTTAELAALSSAMLGYVEWVADEVAKRAVGARSAIAEAIRRRRVERDDDERIAESLIGIPLDAETIALGLDFVQGVLERDGGTELASLFVDERALPTPAEITAPGLWLARLSLPGDETEPGVTDAP